MSSHGFVRLPPRTSTRWAGAQHPLALALTAFVAVRLLSLAALVALTRSRGTSAYRFLVMWDAQWYRHIAVDGYGYTRYIGGRAHPDYAFFPLFPLLERGTALGTGLPFAAAGIMVAVIASLLAAWGIYAVASLLYGARVGLVAAVLWAALPVSLVQWMSYSESLFTALAAWSLHAVLTRRWVLAGVLAAGAGLTRPVGAAVAAAVALAALLHLWRARRGFRRQDLRAVAALVLAPLGWLGYVAWVGWRLGSATAYFDVQRDWLNGFDGGVAFAHWTLRLLAGPMPVLGLLVVVGVAALLGLLVWTVREHQPLPLVLYSAGLVALALATHHYFGSKPRYLLPAFPLLLPPARRLAAGRPWLSGALLVVLAVGSAVFGAFWLVSPGAP